MYKWKRRLSINRCVISFVLIILFYNNGLTQTLAYYKSRKLHIRYSIRESTELPKVDFYFPRFDDFAPLPYGYNVTSPAEIQLAVDGSKEEFSEIIVFTRFFTRNIAKVFVSAAGGNCPERVEIEFHKDGYQVPGMNSIGCMVTAIKERPSLRISYTLIDSTRPFVLMIGDLWIGANTIEKFLSPSAMFVQFPFANAKVQKTFPNSPFDSYGECAYFPKNQKEEDFKGVIFVEDSVKNSAQLLSEIFIPLLQKYPFYRIRNINKKLFIERARLLIQRTRALPLCSYIDSLNNFLSKNLKDAHFSIRSSCSNKRAEKTPLYAYPINGHHVIAGVFDDSLRNSIPLGSEIVKIDEEVIDGVNYDGRDINALLKKLPGQKVNIVVKIPDGRNEQVTYSIKEKYKIPPAFSPGNFVWKVINDTVAYYKINKINSELPLDFVSKLDSINTKKKLILDFRNNGGGDFLAGAQFLSYFINHRFTYFKYEDVNTNIIDSVVVNENRSPFHYRADGKIILLIDESTACIAELVVHTLRTKRNEVTIIGREPSRGALSFIYEINLPKDNIVIATNSLDTGRFLLGGKSIEGKGISPDVRVVMNSVRDLQPYEDKVLTTAISK